jgi:hypothetical protein
MMNVNLFGIIEVNDINLMQIIDFVVRNFRQERGGHCLLIDLIDKNLSNWYDVYSKKFANAKIIEYTQQTISQDEIDKFVAEISYFSERNRFFEAAKKYGEGLEYLKKAYSSPGVLQKIMATLENKKINPKELINNIDDLKTSVENFAKIAKKQKLEFIDNFYSTRPKISLNDLKETKNFLRDEVTKISGICSKLINELNCDSDCVNSFYTRKKDNNYPT